MRQQQSEWAGVLVLIVEQVVAWVICCWSSSVASLAGST
jgi:hypothetical protein